MQVVVLANPEQKRSLTAQGSPAAGVVWVEDEQAFLEHRDADAFMDLEFVNTEERHGVLRQLLSKTVIVNSVADTLADLHPDYVRINAWDTFLSAALIEAACSNEATKAAAEKAFSLFQKEVQWLPDEPGFVTARVVSMLVNEAFLTLGEGVSSREQIDTAMKLGTAYPYGPFEWAEKIGLQNIVTLLQKLSAVNHRYAPAELLVQETNKAI